MEASDEDGGRGVRGRITFRDGEKELPGGSRGHTPLSFSSTRERDLSPSRSTSVASVGTRGRPVMLLVIESCPRDRRRCRCRLES